METEQFLLDNCLPDNYPPTNCPQDNYLPDNHPLDSYPLCQLPLGQLPPMPIASRTIEPCVNSPGQLPTIRQFRSVNYQIPFQRVLSLFKCLFWALQSQLFL